MKVKVLSQINKFIVFLLGVMGFCVSCEKKYGCPEPIEKYGCPADTAIIVPMYGVQTPSIDLQVPEDN